MQVPYVEGVAIHSGPEPCADACKGVGEASAGECIGQPMSRERVESQGPTPSAVWKATRMGAIARVPIRPGVVVDPGMCRRSLSLGTGRARVRPLGPRPPVRVRKVRNRS